MSDIRDVPHKRSCKSDLLRGVPSSRCLLPAGAGSDAVLQVTTPSVSGMRRDIPAQYFQASTRQTEAVISHGRCHGDAATRCVMWRSRVSNQAVDTRTAMHYDANRTLVSFVGVCCD
ncbi:hypothetical protein ElyMa_000634800 [Elysia marginata]|uniref:Uncharacterized protein n=1 Tax=Elysia marginata TaxID=1093978 RepID=A0AAV4GAU5_9GAST|nr:hypothetical protein ElyMa_000634800 [Elysia marginata]